VNASNNLPPMNHEREFSVSTRTDAAHPHPAPTRRDHPATQQPCFQIRHCSAYVTGFGPLS
jgi:hypothetical protein